MRGIALNFFPLSTEEFTFTLHRLPYLEGERPELDGEQAVRRSLEVDGEKKLYWTLFQKTQGSAEIVCGPYDNNYATIDALRLALIESCNKKLNASDISVVGNIHRSVELCMGTYLEGSQVVRVEPYLLRSRGKFGFLADFRFHPTEEHRRTRRALQLSLSLDSRGQSNRNHYADRYSHLAKFVEKFHSVIFPLTLPGGHEVGVDTSLMELPSEKLDIKHYVVGSRRESKSQFMGVKERGPLKHAPDDTRLCFLYRQEDRPLSHDLFRALRGDTYRTFSGMEQMFALPLTRERVSGIPLSTFSSDEIRRVADQVVADAKGGPVVPVVLTPFSRHDDPEDNDYYWHLKHAFLSRGLPIQVVATETVSDRNKLKWSTASIGLQVFAKAGGTPWKVQPRTERCLMVGIGQAHRQYEGHISRYFAYSVLTDSSGVFEKVTVLGDRPDENEYMREFNTNLRQIFNDYSEQFSNFVIHSTFAIRRTELEAIHNALSERRSQSDDGEFVSLKFNDRNRFFGFAIEHNSRVPYESSLVRLSKNEFLVWFEGLQYGQPTVGKMVSNPVHVQFTYPLEELARDRQRAHLQDAINLSGANWRGFNAKSLPVSVYYAQLIAKYLKEFEKHGLPAVDVDTLTPWFL